MSDRTELVRTGDGRRIAVPGNTVGVLYGGEQTGDAYALIEFEFAPGFAVPLAHSHEREDELVVVLAGQLEVTVGERREQADDLVRELFAVVMAPALTGMPVPRDVAAAHAVRLMRRHLVPQPFSAARFDSAFA